MDDLSSLNGQTILVTGANGMLGRAFVEAIDSVVPGARLLPRGRHELDVTDRDRVMAEAHEQPDIIIHCAGLTIAEECERRPERTRQVHVGGTANIAALARESAARLLFPQSILIYDGEELPVTEHTTPSPTSVYGHAKVEAERLALEVPRSLVVRMAGFFGGDDKDKNFVGQITRTFDRMLAEGQMDIEVGDRVWQPTYTLDHARNCLLLLAREREGIYMMGSKGEASFYEVASACVEILGLDQRIRVRRASSQQFDARERVKRPARMVVANDRLDAEGLNRQRPWRAALAEYLQRPWFDRLRDES